MNKKSEIYVSIDVEADGPIPGPHSMLSLGAAAFDDAGTLIETFTVNLECLPDAQPHPDTWAWWQQNLAAYEETRRDCVTPESGVQSFVAWLDALPGLPVAVAAPAGFDFMFTYWYLIRFAGRSPFSFSCVDVKSVVMTLLHKPYRLSGKRVWPRRWFSGRPHTHVAIDDAIEQGESFMLMKREFGLPPPK
jgi:hypothetical protein